MNLDKLIKLVKLANNNPNENEANLAARRVCKMIAGGDYKFVNDQPIITHIPSSPFGDNLADFIRRYASPYVNTNPWTNESPPPPKQEPVKKEPRSSKNPFDFDYEWYNANNPFTGYKYSKPKQEKRPLNCRTCKKPFNTAFVGPPQMFQCHECYYEEYKKEHK